MIRGDAPRCFELTLPRGWLRVMAIIMVMVVVMVMVMVMAGVVVLSRSRSGRAGVRKMAYCGRNSLENRPFLDPKRDWSVTAKKQQKIP